MRTSALGSRATPLTRLRRLFPRGAPPAARQSRIRGVRWEHASLGFTLIELLVVLAIVAIASSLVVVSLRDSAQSQLDEEAERLAALLEGARTEARASGIAARWEPASAEATDGANFRFIGLPKSSNLPSHWLRPGVSAEIVGARAVQLGPEPILPAQRIVLSRDERRTLLASDGLAPFARAPFETPTP